jgi:hypothetical protein
MKIVISLLAIVLVKNEINADLRRQGEKSIEWVMQEAVAGKVFAASHAEKGNDVPVVWSTTKAEKVEGGYKFTGKKSFKCRRK